MSTKENRVKTLMEENETIESQALKNAHQRYIDEESKKQEELLLEQFRHSKQLLNEAVVSLRNIREAEARKKKEVIAIDKALEQFKKDGDYEAFRKAYMKA